MRQTAEWANAHHKESADKMTRAMCGVALDPALIQPVIDNAQRYGTFPHPVTASELIWSRAPVR